MFEALATQSSRAVQRIATSTTANAGAASLGSFLGFLILAFVTHGGDYTIATLGSIIAAIGGATVVGLLDKTKGGSSAVSWYLIGLSAGAVAYVLLALAGRAGDVFPPARPGPPGSPNPTQ